MREEVTPVTVSSPSLLPPVLGDDGRNARTPEPRLHRLFPLARTLRDYRASDLRPDLVAGLTVALFTVPQGMAYALIAGFPPAAGLWAAVVASILGAAFGSSEFLINGPTNAISVMIAANVALFSANGDTLNAIVMLTLLMGGLQVLAGVLRVGSLTRFVSEPVLTGFTAGAGVYIVINQLPAFLGIDKSAIASEVFGMTLPKSAVFDLLRLLTSLSGIAPVTLGLSLCAFLTVRLLQRLEKHAGRRLPAPFLAVVLATGLVALFDLDMGAAGERVKVVRDIEPLTRSLPQLHWPHATWRDLQGLFGASVSIALMGSVEAIAIGKALATRAGHGFDASRQLIGEGLCNVGAALVGGFASSGSFSRTMVNYEAGAITRMSCIFSGLMALALLVAFAPLANSIPIAALAGTLVHIGLKLVDVARLRVMLSTTSGDRAVLLVTFTAVLFVEHLENALFLGIAASIYYALRRAEGFKLRVLTFDDDGGLRELPEGDLSRVDEITVLNLQGELFFAAAEELQAELIRVLDTSRARFVVLRLQEAYNMDATTAAVLANVADEARRRSGRLLLCGVRPGMYGTLARAGLIARLGEDAVFQVEREMLASTRHAVGYARTLARG